MQSINMDDGRRKVDPVKLREYIVRGLRDYEIRALMDIDQSTLWRNKVKFNLVNLQTKAYKENKAAIVEADQMKALEIMDLIKAGYDEDKVNAMSDHDKRALLHTLQGGIGITDNIIRLERGQATEIIDKYQYDKSIEELQREIEELEGKTINITPVDNSDDNTVDNLND